MSHSSPRVVITFLDLVQDIYNLITDSKSWHGDFIHRIIPWSGGAHSLEALSIIKYNIDDEILKLSYAAVHPSSEHTALLAEQRDFLNLVLNKVITPRYLKLKSSWEIDQLLQGDE
jgi:hypothetical protein